MGFLRILGGFYQKEITHVPGKISHKLSKLSSAYDQILKSAYRTCHISLEHFSQKLAEHFRIHSSQNLQDFVISQCLPQIKGNALIQKLSASRMEPSPAFAT